MENSIASPSPLNMYDTNTGSTHVIQFFMWFSPMPFIENQQNAAETKQQNLEPISPKPCVLAVRWVTNSPACADMAMCQNPGN